MEDYCFECDSYIDSCSMVKPINHNPMCSECAEYLGL